MMKSRKVKAAEKGKAYMSKKKLKGNIPLDSSENESDIDSESYFHDEIDDFHKEQDDKLSTDDEFIQHRNVSSEEEEVLPISDESDSDSDEGLPNPEAWGKRKSTYYNADFVDEDRGRTYREEDAEAAKAEADEALAIQKSVYNNVNFDNLGANFLFECSESSEDEFAEQDLAAATKHEKIKFLKNTDPEMFEFCKDYKTSMIEVRDKLLPLLTLARDGKLPTETCVQYLKIRYHLLLHYSLNINFYMMLKSSGSKRYNHPVRRRINSFKKFFDELAPVDDAVNEDIKVIAEKARQKKGLNPAQDLAESTVLKRWPARLEGFPTIKVKESKRKNTDTETEKEILSLIGEVKQEMKKRKIAETDRVQDEADQDGHIPAQDDENQLDEKRAITYQIAKNKGLVPRRKKEYRNPRVKHRMKFRKANIRRKGQVREVVKEIKRYDGEPTGISTHVVKSIKLK